MILYLEDQLDACYRIYCLHQVRHDMAFMKREDYRLQFEEVMEKIYENAETE
mgnify:FL=1